MEMALRGIRVVELVGLAPAPFCGMILADFGATVIRVDKVKGATDQDCLCNGKKSIALNLKDEEGKDVFRKLCKQSDVLIEPFRKGTMEKLGLGPRLLLKDNPRLIYARLTGYGQEGTMSKKAGHDINFVSLSGLLSLFGRSGEKPIFPANFVADFAGGGLMCAFGILAALLERNHSNLGQVVDCSMVEGAAYTGSWLYRSQSLPIWGNNRGENILDSGAHFYEVYETKDGKFMAVGALEPKFYMELLKGLGLTIEEIPHFGNFKENKRKLEEIFKQKSQKEWCEIFDNLDSCVTPVLTLKEAPVHKHNILRKAFVKDYTNEHFVPEAAPKLSRTPGRTLSTLTPPENGKDTESILKELNYSNSTIENLEKKGVIKTIKKCKL